MDQSLLSALVASGIVSLAAAHAAAQTATVDLAGALIQDNTDQVRTSAEVLAVARGYTYEIDAMIKGRSGLASLLIPDPLPLADVLDLSEPGQSRLLSGVVRNDVDDPCGVLPATIFKDSFAGTVATLDLEFTIEVSVQTDGRARVDVTMVDIPLPFITGSAEVTAGSVTVNVWDPVTPETTEWHFNGDFATAPGSGPARIRYLDDPAFGDVWDSTDTPNPSIPKGITETQSVFGLASSFGIDLINGMDAGVYKTSPSYNLDDPALDVFPFLPNPDLSRGIGLAMWPGEFPSYPDQKIGHWTLVWDMYIPQGSWDMPRPGETARYPVALVEDSFSNNESADGFIQIDGAGDPGIGYATENFNDYLRTNLIAPERWMRIALVSDGYTGRPGRIYIDGAFVGLTGGDWLYNSVDATDPRYGDGEAVDPADWTAWGEFPSPWAQSTAGVPLGALALLFADLPGRGEPVYIANMMFTDKLMGPNEVASMGSADACGILFKKPICADGSGACCLFTPGERDDCFVAQNEADCVALGGTFQGIGASCVVCPEFCPADWNGDSFVNPQDWFDFVNDFFSRTGPHGQHDFNDDAFENAQDFFDFVNHYFCGC